MKSRSWESLESFVRQEACISSKKSITPVTSVEDDLGQQGDDADLFMQRFFEAFDVDRGDYDFHRYFLMEGEGVLYHLLSKYLMRRNHTLKREPLTVGMLHAALLNGKWDSGALSQHK
ncbi:hypothetical protein LMG28688_04525 [Paraburkholderia caffeinitolerans]|uniref:Acyl carrier protein n=1 Tax=Paraburkholderia caffeinitolerans TaxID=1723730 RepID=A0A6J5GDX4_9BURK|nr:DUF1493 family protein [Paraburkholderia caffeinitolerans]CAB3797439.1 hypothetical protein LMG28688_04525 [Paraburkholderia caffeinitolerans]